jgi:hypothetical protein
MSVPVSTILILFSQLFLAAEVIYVVVLAATKISILAFYFRVFRRPVFLKAVWATVIFVMVSTIITMFLIIFQCNPVSGAWDRTKPNKCMSLNGLAYSASGISIGQDIFILVLPISELAGLQMTMTKKLNVLAMFGVGAMFVTFSLSHNLAETRWTRSNRVSFHSATITSIIRLKFIVSFGSSKDTTWDSITPALWSLIEINVAMICACLPAIRALLSKVLPSIFDIGSEKSRLGYTRSEANNKNNGTNNSGFWNHDRGLRHASKGSFGDEEAAYEMDSTTGRITKTTPSKAEDIEDRSKTMTPSLDIAEFEPPKPYAAGQAETMHYDDSGSDTGLVPTKLKPRPSSPPPVPPK